MAGLTATYVTIWVACLAAVVVFNTEGPFVVWAFLNFLGLVALGVYGLVNLAARGK